MKVKFTAPNSKTITLTKGDEAVELTIHALPPGYGPMLRSSMAPPNRFLNGKPTPNYNDPQYNDLYGMLLVAKALEPSGVMETKLKGPWTATAEAVREEFRASGFTDGDLGLIIDEVGKISSAATVEDTRKN